MRFNIIVYFSLFLGSLSAQCPFSATIDPKSVILCPGDSVTLLTQSYDAYVWLKDGNPIASSDSFIVVHANQIGSYVVLATLNGCTDSSDAVFVDSWVFLPPFVETIGSLVDTSIGTVCQGDSLWLVVHPPIDTLIQWTEGGNDILGAISDTLLVLNSGSYSVGGASLECPNYNMSLGLNIDFQFINCDSNLTKMDVLGESGLVQVYPNPSLGEVFVVNQHENQQEIHLKNIQGEVVWSGDVDSGQTQNIYLPAGLYYLEAIRQTKIIIVF